MISSAKTAFALLLCTMLLGTSAFARSSGVRNKCPKNCYPMLIMRIIDADTVQGYIHTNDDEAVIYAKLRFEGVDTPEKGRPGCMEEKLLALLARDYLAARLAPIIQARSANRACACDAQGGKFAKRRIGSLKIKQPGAKKWQDISSSLLKKCYALPYHGGKRVNWCSCLKGNKCPTAQFPARCIKRFTGKLK